MHFKPPYKYSVMWILTLLLLSTTCPVLANSVNPDQMASQEAKCSGSALFAIKYVVFYKKKKKKKKKNRSGISDRLEISGGRGFFIYSA